MAGRLRESWAKLRALFHRQEMDEDLSAELESHLDCATDDYVRAGHSAEEARRLARMRLGGVAQTMETQRDARGWTFLESVLQDGRHTMRTLRREKGFALFAVLILALGIGASATVFSVVHTLLLRPLPLREPDQLVWIAGKAVTDGDLSGETLQVSRVQELARLNKSFSEIAGYFAFYGTGDAVLTGSGNPERFSSVPVSQRFFQLLGVRPELGRYFSAEECKWNGAKAVMMSHALWTYRFGGDRNVVGRVLRINGNDVTVAGVLPATFDFGAIFAPGTRVDLFEPFPMTNETDRWGNTLAVIGRLRPGVSLKRAQAEASILGAEIVKQNPRGNGLDPVLTRLPEHVSGKVRPAIMVLAAGVGVVMLIVCANLSNLFLARAAGRQREIAVRVALGAGRQRLLQQLLTESLLLTFTGSAVGLLLAYLGCKAIAHMDSFSIPLLTSVQVSGTTVLFTTGLALLTGLTLGFAPALQAAAQPLRASLGQRGSSGGSKGQVIARGTLVICEVVFACVLLVVAGLLIRSFLQVLAVNPGFRAANAATWRVDPPAQYKTDAQRNSYYDQLLAKVRNLPGVQGAGLTDVLPLGHNRSWGAGAYGQVYKDGEYPDAFVRIVTDGYVSGMGMTLRKGRDFTSQDRTERAHPVALVNEALAAVLWPGEDPIGKRLQPECGNKEPTEVVGVLGNVHHIALEQPSGSELYLPMRQCGDASSVELVVRSSMPLPVLASKVEPIVRSMLPDLPKGTMRPLTRLVDRSISPRRFLVWLLSGFAGFALVLASLGIYGVISYSVTRRTQEIGVRMALGALASRVQLQILKQTLLLAASGLAIGTLISAALGKSVGALLFGVTPGDPATLTLAAAAMLCVAAVAGYLPALRASRIDPAIALRAD